MTQSTFNVYPSLAIGVTQLTGVDNKTFLQGQLTCDLDLLSPQKSALGAHCDAKGKMLAILRLLQVDQTVLALQALSNVESHLPSLKKYAVFSKVEIVDASAQYRCTGLSGHQALSWANSLTNEQLSDQQDSIETAYGVITSSPLMLDDEPRLVVVSTENQILALNEALATCETTTLSDKDWESLDIQCGSPQITPALQAEFVPQMLNMQMIDGINFKKGCYIGQETVARMHFRGLNKRAMFIVRASSHIALQPGDNLERQVGENWRNAGTIISVNHTDGKTVACAILPSDIELDCQLRAKNSDDDSQLMLSTPSYFSQS